MPLQIRAMLDAAAPRPLLARPEDRLRHDVRQSPDIHAIRNLPPCRTRPGPAGVALGRLVLPMKDIQDQPTALDQV